ncbi:cytochrome b [Nitratireductor mangrovi]|uniref:Cytochrome b n=1 Tax=Nitratireductor mangrovi TaxID=2599600 RepID=A0A5B8L5K2_9HYPH|nr:cytochrome b/b6 domain-containing protein [Nitratireductor mangrovi]QDZ03052.2 cytochrome b [Nitratireductor mangrovi]
MSWKSSRQAYGSVAIALHWLSALFVIVLVASGLRLEALAGSPGAIPVLRVHVMTGLAVAALTIARLLWWIVADRRPEPPAGQPRWQIRAAHAVHLAFYPLILAAAASGIATIVLSGAAPILVSGAGAPLPDFTTLPPRAAHGLIVWALIVLAVLHAAAALYHQFARRDRLMVRILPDRQFRDLQP